MTNLFRDTQLGKETSFSFPRPLEGNPENISGIFSYGDKEGLVWNRLVPSEIGASPTYASMEEAFKEYYKEDYFVITLEQSKLLWSEEGQTTYKKDGKAFLPKTPWSEKTMEKYNFPIEVVRLSF